MLFFTFSSFSDKKRILVFLAEALSVFLCLYSLVSALLWVFEIFSVEFCTVAVTAFVTAFFAFVYFKSKKKGVAFFSLGGMVIDQSAIINGIFIIVVTLISLGAYSTIGIGYNDGNAQTQAISILNGQNSLEFEIDEYSNITSDSAYEFYFADSISNIDRDEFTASYRIDHDYSREGKQKYLLARYGSNPVYPSILALSGSLFGIKRMAYIQAVFAFCSFAFISEILRKLKCDWKLRTILVVLLGVSPIFVYCNHTTLMEPLFGFCMLMFLYFLLCKKQKLQVLSVLGVITFAFLHTSVYTMLPLFLILYWMYYFHSGKIRHLISSGLMIVGYILSFAFLNITAYENTSINYRIGMPFLGNNYYIFIIFMLVINIIAGVILAVIRKKADKNKLREFERGIGVKIFKIIVAISAFIPIPMTAVLVINDCYSFQDFLSLTFIAFTVCSGVLLIPYVLVRLISTKYPLGLKEATVILMFLYSVVLYSFAMKPILKGYYYDSRYISSFIPFAIIVAGLMLRLLKEEAKYYIPIIGIVLLLIPFSLVILDPKTDTRFDKNLYEDVMQTVEKQADKDTVVFIEKSLLKYFYYPLLASTDAKIYPIEIGYFDMFCADTNDYYSSVLYITDEKGDNYASKGSLQYLNFNIPKLASESDFSLILGLPTKFNEGDSDKIQIIRKDATYRFLNVDLYDILEKDDISLSVDDIEITDEGKAIITVSVTGDDQVYYNEKYLLSYHLEYENEEDIYDLPRIPIGPLIIGDYTIEINLNNQPKNVTAVIDIVEEGVEWYSWENRVPVILFNKMDNDWDYKVYNFYTKL